MEYVGYVGYVLLLLLVFRSHRFDSGKRFEWRRMGKNGGNEIPDAG